MSFEEFKISCPSKQTVTCSICEKRIDTNQTICNECIELIKEYEKYCPQLQIVEIEEEDELV